MAIEITETHELIKVIENRTPEVNYFLDLLYPEVHESQTEYIDFDIVDTNRRLAPFVAPNVQGQPMVERGHALRKFKPAYIKPKNAVSPDRLLRRRAGELLRNPGIVTPQEREDAIVADILNMHVDGIIRRWEWMAAKAALDGAVTIAGENYPEVTLSFGRNAAHTKTLATLWTDPASNPLTDIDTWNNEMMSNAGYPITRLTMGPQAWQAFINHAATKDMLETRRGSTTTIETGPGDGQPVQYRGTLKSANIELYVYSGYYEDNLGAHIPMMDTDDVLATNAGAFEGVRAFGAIMDRKAAYQSLAIFPKMWEQEDPSGLFLMTQSAPLMIPGRPNASMRITVR